VLTKWFGQPSTNGFELRPVACCDDLGIEKRNERTALIRLSALKQPHRRIQRTVWGFLRFPMLDAHVSMSSG
jgi:hypothetical protein